MKGQKRVPWYPAVELSFQQYKEFHAPGGWRTRVLQKRSAEDLPLCAFLSFPAQKSVHTTHLPPGSGLGKPFFKNKEMRHHRILRNLQLPFTLFISSFFFYLNSNFRYLLHNTEVTFQVELKEN